MTKAKAKTAPAATRAPKTGDPVGTGPAPGVTKNQGIPTAGRIGKNNVTSRPVTPGNSGTQPGAAKEAARTKAKRVTARPKNTEPEGEERDLGELITVQATAVGFIDNARRREGDVFKCREGEFSDRWMVRVDDDSMERVTGPQEALNKIHDEAIGGKLRTQAARAAAGDNDPLNSAS